MMKLLLLAVIVLAKFLIATGVALVCIILSFMFKGKQLHKSALKKFRIKLTYFPFYAAALAFIISITFLIPIHKFKSVNISTTLPRSVNGDS